LSKVDITLVLIIFVGAYGGFREGFIVELISFFGVLLGVLGGFKLMGWAMIVLERKFHIDAKILPYIAFAAIFFIILFIVNLLVRLIRLKADKTWLGGLDQTAGGLLGLIRTVFILSVMLWIFHSMKFSFPENWTENSWVLPAVAEFAPKITHGIGKVLPFFRGVF